MGFSRVIHLYLIDSESFMGSAFEIIQKMGSVFSSESTNQRYFLRFVFEQFLYSQTVYINNIFWHPLAKSHCITM